jgi:hypothetical protein
MQKTARFAVAHRDAGLSAEVVLGVARDIHAVLTALVAWVGLARGVEIHRKTPSDGPNLAGIFDDQR